MSKTLNDLRYESGYYRMELCPFEECEQYIAMMNAGKQLPWNIRQNAQLQGQPLTFSRTAINEAVSVSDYMLCELLKINSAIKGWVTFWSIVAIIGAIVGIAVLVIPK